ncbi:hypothetical protein OSB04_007996 [Centaurea solstitialis]|uniref:Trafficking protein particle complex II-specific subunit 130 homolog n=1 Tax=Centaurea solstitialis TaxID=347529 RepID=A0AA38WTL4_9ASTR|nr:hypothetical protein OSB04_007996 [Centaurea solstitialis]
MIGIADQKLWNLGVWIFKLNRFTVEDVSDLWPLLKEGFQRRLPFKKTILNNKTRNPVPVEKLPAEFILTTDPRLRSQFPQEQLPFWFREPYATVVLVTCEDLDEFKTVLKPRLKSVVQNDEEWFILYVSKAAPNNDKAINRAKKVYSRLEVDFNTRKRERCCKLDLHAIEATFWDELELKIIECLRNTLDRRIQLYEEEIRKLSEQRFMPVWSFCSFFILKESLAFMFDMAQLHEDSLREYDELELCYLETVNNAGKHRDFGGMDHGDDQAALLDPDNKHLSQIVQDNSFREFEFRQYLFACQAKVIIYCYCSSYTRPFEVASRGFSFVISFSEALAQHESILPFCLREVWVLTACVGLVIASAEHYREELLAPEIKKEYYRVQGELFSLCRVKFMRLACLVGYGADIERSPVNSASLSMLPWPKPAVWPTVSPDDLSEVLEKEKVCIFIGLLFFNLTYLLCRCQGPILHQETLRARLFFRRFAEIFVASEHLFVGLFLIPIFLKSLSSLEEFEKRYLELTKGAADNYHYSWWKRHGVVLDGQIAAIFFKHGNYDLAAKSYEKVCALYSGEGWQDLLADLLPNLAECQKILDDQAGTPMELYAGDPGSLSVNLWSDFPDDIALEALSLTLTATNNVMNLLRNLVSYVLGVLTGQIGHLRFRSHGFSRGGPADSDDLMILFMCYVPIFRCFKPRSLVDLAAAVSSALLMNEPQWVGIIVKPFGYSLKGAVFHIGTGPGLRIEESCAIEMETYVNAPPRKPDGFQEAMVIVIITLLPIPKSFAQLTLGNGSIELPDWASNRVSVIWIPVCAISDGLARGTTAGFDDDNFSFLSVLSIVVIDRTVAVHFTDPFHVSTRVSDEGSDGALLLQVQFFLVSPQRLELVSCLVYPWEQPPPKASARTFLSGWFSSLPSDGLIVGKLFTMKWRLERLKFLEEEEAAPDKNDGVVYEVKANSRNWMIAGRKRGLAPLSAKQGSRIEISILCVPLATGYVRPPQLELPNVKRANICCNPAGPHLVCVLPPPLSSSFCIPS